MKLLEIDVEFQALCPPLQAEERAQLEASLLAEGCRDPLCVWWEQAETRYCKNCYDDRPVHFGDGRWECDQCGFGVAPDVHLLLDGHNRHALCEQHHIPYETQEIELHTREEAINWIIANQLGRRNLTPEQKSYLRGKRYNLEKTGGHGESGYEKDTQKTRERLAKEYKVSTPTISKDGDFATAVDTLESQVRQDIRDTILRRQDREHGKITKQQAMLTGKLVQEHTVTPQPFMRREGWKPYQVLEAIEVLGMLPTEEHAPLNTLLDQPFIPADDGLDMLKKVQVMASEQRQRIYQLASSDDPRDRSDAKTLAAQIPPEPDPQLMIVQHLIVALDNVRTQQRRNWRRAFPDEPWIDDLEAIDTMMADIQERWRDIAARIKTSYTERIASYAIPVTT